MRKVHPEFAYQSRELEGQIDGILGDPPNRKNYDMMQSTRWCPNTPAAAASKTST
jgi:hypothetical protein